MTVAIEGGEWSTAHPGRTLPSGKTQYPFYRRLGGKSRHYWDSIPDRPARSSVAILTEVPGPCTYIHIYIYIYIFSPETCVLLKAIKETVLKINIDIAKHIT